jgi:hypothetical protein
MPSLVRSGRIADLRPSQPLQALADLMRQVLVHTNDLFMLNYVRKWWPVWSPQASWCTDLAGRLYNPHSAVAVLAWLHDNGCPVDWHKALKAASRNLQQQPALTKWLMARRLEVARKVREEPPTAHRTVLAWERAGLWLCIPHQQLLACPRACRPAEPMGRAVALLVGRLAAAPG